MTQRNFIIAIIIALVVIAICIAIHEHNIEKKRRRLIAAELIHRNEKPDKEGFAFFSSGSGAYVDEKTGAIRGPGVYTNQMVNNKSATDLLDEVKKDQYYAEPGDFGAPYQPTGLDELVKSQNEINRINAKNKGGLYSEDDKRKISELMQKSTAANGAYYSLFNRAGSQVTELRYQPNATVGVIDQDFIPERLRDNRVSIVGSAVPIKGFDFHPDRLSADFAAATSGKKPSAMKPIAVDGNKASIKNALDAFKTANTPVPTGVTSEDIEDPSRLRNGLTSMIIGQ